MRNRFLFLFPILMAQVAGGTCLAQAQADAETSRAASFFQVREIPPGPWGRLEYSGLILEPPDHFIDLSDDLKNWRQGIRWALDVPTREEAAEILSQAGISPEMTARLTSQEMMTQNGETGFFEIHPAEGDLLALTPEQRSKLYPRLAPKVPENPYFVPFALPSGGIRDVTVLPAGVPEGTIDLIEQLSYRKAGVMRFSDIVYLFQKTSSEEERRRILKTIGRETSLAVRLVLSDESDLATLERFWGAGGRNREILPILLSVVTTAGVDRLDIAHLLPPTPRKLLNTYPSPEGYGLPGESPDCFWTAASFFAEEPPERYLDFVSHVIKERYEIVTPPYQLGDLILISDPSTEEPIHACNFIAEDLVFTKNGRSSGRPWVLSNLKTVLERYLKVEEVNLSFYRLKSGFRQ